MSRVELTREQARYLSILAAQDLRRDREYGLNGMADRHQGAWDKLQPACEWEWEGEEFAEPRVPDPESLLKEQGYEDDV